MVIEAYLRKHAMEYPGRPAVATLEGQLTYAELWGNVRKLAFLLRHTYGIRRGDRVLIRSSQTLEHIISYFAIHLAGAVAVPLEKDVPQEVLDEMGVQSESRLLLSWQEEAVDPGITVLPLAGLGECLRDCGFTDDWTDFPEETVHADIMLTTGTTGKSKGVILSQENLLATAENLIYGFRMKPSDCMLVVGPLNHANPIRKVYTAVILGSSAVVINGMSPIRNFYRALDLFPVNCLCLPPSAVHVMLAMSGDKIRDYENRIQYVENSTAPMPGHLREKLKELLPKSRLYNGYGSSEAGSIAIYDYAFVDKEPDCAGKPSRNASLFFVDDEGKRMETSKDRPGLLACDGAVNFQGYLADRKRTEEALRDGIVYTSDLGYFDGDGYVHLVGRKDSVINLGGLKVSPEEVESIMEEYAGTKESMLVEGHDPALSSFLKALVLPGPGFDMGEFKRYLRERLESYKIPREIELVDKIPHTYNGKKNRSEPP